MVLTGNTPPGIGHLIKRELYHSNADLEDVQAVAHMTTSEGRHHARRQFKRYIEKLQDESQEKLGYRPKAEKIERNILDLMLKPTLESIENSNAETEQNEIQARQSRFDKKYKKN